MPLALVVDDDMRGLRAICRVVSALGFDVAEAKDGVLALKAARAKPPDLAIVDIFMPEKDGIETLIELRKLKSDMKIIAISGGGLKGRMDLLDMATRLGADMILRKPFQAQDLAEAIKAVHRSHPVALHG